MKKAIFTLSMIFLLILPAYSEYVSQMSKPLQLQAAYDEVAFIDIKEIASQSQAFLQGMPFNIEESYVAYGGTENGRLVATWSMITNDKVKIRIAAQPLLPEDPDMAKNASPLSYRLLFTYLLGYSDDNNNHHEIAGEEFEVYSSTSSFDPESPVYSGEFDPMGSIAFGQNSGQTAETKDYSYVGSLDGSIYFQFTQEATTLIDRYRGQDSPVLPAGNYTAEVRIELVEV